MKFLLPILLIALSGALLFLFISPTYDEVKVLKAEAASYDQALDNSRELQKVRDALLAKYNNFPNSDVDRLEKLLPDAVDNVKLVLDIDHISSKYGMVLRNVRVSEIGKDEKAPLGPDTRDVGSVILSFAVSSSYDNFVNFIRDLEKSLRLVDLTAITFKASDKDLTDYEISVKTYWLK